MKLFAILILTILVSGCQVFRPADVPATLQAQNATHLIEATAIAQTQIAQAAGILATVQADETHVAQQEGINQALVLTVRAGDPPTVERGVGSAPGAVSTPGTAGTTEFVEIQTAVSVRESDGCADGIQTQFSPDTQQIYLTARALNVRAGTRLDIEWRFEGEVAWQDNWTVPIDSDDFCLWFFIDPATVAFSPGNWSVQLFADGIPAGSPASFSILGAMPDG